MNLSQGYVLAVSSLLPLFLITDREHVTVPATQITVFYKKTTYINCRLEGLYELESLRNNSNLDFAVFTIPLITYGER